MVVVKSEADTADKGGGGDGETKALERWQDEADGGVGSWWSLRIEGDGRWWPEGDVAVVGE